MTSSNEPTVIRLHGDADVDVARELRNALLKSAGQQTITIDCSEVDRLGAPALQVLLSYIRQFGSAGLTLQGDSARFSEYFRLGGFDAHLPPETVG